MSSSMKNFCVKLAERPGVNGTPRDQHFAYSECEYPEIKCDDDEDVSFISSILHFISTH